MFCLNFYILTSVFALKARYALLLLPEQCYTRIHKWNGYIQRRKGLDLKENARRYHPQYGGDQRSSQGSQIKTRYYNLSKERAWEEVSSTLKKIPGYKVLHEVPSVGEIILEKRTTFGRTMDITVSVISVSPVRSAVDMYSASRGSLGDLGSNYRTIMNLFSVLDKKLAKYKAND